MNLDLITKNDLNDFKLELVNLITDIVSKSQPKKKKFLQRRCKRPVRNSTGTLRKYRITGKISYTKIDGILYYKYEDVIKLIESNKFNSLG